MRRCDRRWIERKKALEAELQRVTIADVAQRVAQLGKFTFGIGNPRLSRNCDLGTTSRSKNMMYFAVHEFMRRKQV